MHHDFETDEMFRQMLIERGVYVFPLATKQCSISAAHTADDVEFTLEQVESALKAVAAAANKMS